METYGEALKIAVNHIDVDVNLGVECWENFAGTLYILSKLVIHVYCSISFGQFLFFFFFVLLSGKMSGTQGLQKTKIQVSTTP